ncbi:Putative beta-lactamase HcpC precursor [Candidatus Rubidus massiliensis]|nr:Putative beta-lactamase HcpC precursor [Candidatus Rubidus massiliensis]
MLKNKLVITILSTLFLFSMCDFANGATELERKALSEGDAEAQYQLGRKFYLGEGYPSDFLQAQMFFNFAANQNHPKALFFLAIMSMEGQGIKKDNKQAIKFMERSAQRGFSLAQSTLGGYYLEGSIVPKNINMAKKLLEVSYKNDGNAMACSLLAMMHEKGEGYKQDFQKAAKYYEEGALAGDSHCQYAIGIKYLIGQGVDQNLDKAMEWLKLASDNGNNEATMEVGCCYGKKEDYQNAISWFENAAKQGNAKAKYYLGLYYLEGLGVDSNEQTAKYWFNEALKSGDKRALKFLK